MAKIELTPKDMETLAAGNKVISTNGTEIVLVITPAYATGAELKDFYLNGCDSDYYYESLDASIQIEDDNGEWLAVDSKLYPLAALGTIRWQRTGLPKDYGKKPWMTFEEAFLAWKNRSSK